MNCCRISRMASMYAHIVLVCTLAFVSGDRDRHSIFKPVYDYVLASCDPLMIPTASLPIHVDVRAGLIDIHKVDPEKNTVDVTRWGRWIWNTNVTWNPEDHHGITEMRVPISSIWHPNLHVYNLASNVAILEEPVAIVRHTGEHNIFSKERSELYCDDLSMENKCSLKFASWGLNNQIMNLTDPSESSFQFERNFRAFFLDRSRYELTPETFEKTVFGIAETFPDRADMIVFSFSFKDRRSSYRSQFHGPFRAIFNWS